MVNVRTIGLLTTHAADDDLGQCLLACLQAVSQRDRLFSQGRETSKTNNERNTSSLSRPSSNAKNVELRLPGINVNKPPSSSLAQ